MLNNYKKIIIITFSEININSDSATTYVGIKARVDIVLLYASH